jgi:hypothetical protein
LANEFLKSSAAGFGKLRDQEVIDARADVLRGGAENLRPFRGFVLRCHSERSGTAVPARAVEEPHDLRTTADTERNLYRDFGSVS